jgi:hypothetical protein
MRFACCTVALAACVSLVSAQRVPTFDLPGTLELVDRPPDATPVEAMMLGLHPLRLDDEIQAWPDRDGKFVLKKVKTGRYSLTLPFPGRIRSFAIGSRELAPDGFELNLNDAGSLRIIASLKTSNVSVKVRGLPTLRSNVVALICPADPYLTLRESCFLNALTKPQTTFKYVPLGKYRIFIVDEKFQSDVAAYAPRFPDFLKDQGTMVEAAAKGDTEITTAFVDGETIQRATREAGPLFGKP